MGASETIGSGGLGEELSPPATEGWREELRGLEAAGESASVDASLEALTGVLSLRRAEAIGPLEQRFESLLRVLAGRGLGASRLQEALAELELPLLREFAPSWPRACALSGLSTTNPTAPSGIAEGLYDRLPALLSAFEVAAERVFSKPVPASGRWFRSLVRSLSSDGRLEAGLIASERESLLSAYDRELAELIDGLGSHSLRPSAELREWMNLRGLPRDRGDDHQRCLLWIRGQLARRPDAGHATSAELLADLWTVKDSLREAEFSCPGLQHLAWRVECFGFVGSGLEVPVSSADALGAAAELLGREDFDRLDSQSRLELLENASLSQGGGFAQTTERLLRLLRVLEPGLGSGWREPCGRFLLDGISGAAEPLALVFLARALALSDHRGELSLDFALRIDSEGDLEGLLRAVEAAQENASLRRRLAARRSPLAIVLEEHSAFGRDRFATRWRLECRARRLRERGFQVEVPQEAEGGEALLGAFLVALEGLARADEAPEMVAAIEAACDDSRSAWERLRAHPAFAQLLPGGEATDPRQVDLYWEREGLLLSRWFGLGSAFEGLLGTPCGEACERPQPGTFLHELLGELSWEWPLVDLEAARAGAFREVDPELWELILAEWKRAEAALERVGLRPASPDPELHAALNILGDLESRIAPDDEETLRHLERVRRLAYAPRPR